MKRPFVGEMRGILAQERADLEIARGGDPEERDFGKRAP